MRRYTAICLLILILISALILTGCKESIDNTSTGPGYWCSSSWYTGELKAPYIWFYSEATDGDFKNASGDGGILTDNGWINITINWDENAYMTIKDENGNVLICGSERYKGNGHSFTLYIDTDNVYNFKAISFIFSDSKDVRIPDESEIG
jgi:hypothetical protein